jgi:hypothetical protein
MSKHFQIVAKTDTGANLIWDEYKSDFVDFSKEVPELTIDNFSDEWETAKTKAEQYMGIEEIFMEEIETETGTLKEICASYKPN